MHQIVIIPARYGSTRLPGKALAPISGKPLIHWVYERAGQVPGVDGLYVATDDERIKEVVEGFGGRAVMTRADHASGSDRLAEAAGLLGLDPEDIVINIQGDQAVFPPELINRLAAPLRNDPGVVMATPVRRLIDPEAARNPNVVKVVFDNHGRALYFSRSPLPYWRDGGEAYFYKHIGIYAYRVAFLQTFVTLAPGRWEQAEKLEQLRALEHGFPIQVVETTEDTLEVDTPEDVQRVETYLVQSSRFKVQS
ncbi:MAG: 3-deoxy-manno-octulosonate cytidylyltransferase [Deltaproteobacteria bacterium]|nr:3-deoxy-manno-octulosonate cytidylyltransferase [Desulfitobacteriaceae bacterium]MDI6854614.1 3-deoxy-manno-octulosonate cytidylyltransferase [Deltaproteobacteria bacterium]